MTDSPTDFDARRQLLQMQMLYEVGLALADSLDPTQVGQEILQRALTMVDARAGALLVRSPQGVTTAGQVGDGIDGLLAATAMDDAWTLDAPNQIQSGDPVRHICFVPLRSHSEVHGLLVVVDHEVRGGATAFGDGDLELLDSFALQAGAALRNARLHQDLIDAQQKLQQMEQLRALGDLAAELAHSMRHTLGLVVGHADGWLTLNGDAKKAMTAVLTAAEEGQQVIDRIHQFTRLGVGRERNLTDINQLVRDGVASARELVPEATVDWQLPLADDLPQISINAEDMTEVIVNLAENAARACSESGSLIRIATQRRGDGVRLTVTDDGPGIASDIIDNIFDPFFSTRDADGAGLGLSIALRVVEDHGGSLSVDSTPGQGTTFTVDLPPSSDTPAAAPSAALLDDAAENPDRR